nr:calnexin homolog [Ipomoea batatas]
MKQNPALQGRKWQRSPQLTTPAVQGHFGSPREIPNPDYFELDKPNFAAIASFGIDDLQTMPRSASDLPLRRLANTNISQLGYLVLCSISRCKATLFITASLFAGKKANIYLARPLEESKKERSCREHQTAKERSDEKRREAKKSTRGWRDATGLAEELA